MLKRFRHWSPRYVQNRLALIAYERRNPDAPWLTAQMIEILMSWLKPTDVGLEWGSGRSTPWLAKRVRHLTSIEDDMEWSDRVEQLISTTGCGDRVTLHRAPLAKDDLLRPAAARYVQIGGDIARSSLDFALVDGSLRDCCAAIALERLKRGGTLIIDNVERYIPRREKSHSPNARGLADGFESVMWEHVFRAIEDWRCIWTSNGVTDTALWVKP